MEFIDTIWTNSSAFISGSIDYRSIFAVPLALFAGVIAGLNPCCLPIYPAAAGCCAALRRETVRGNLWIATLFILGGSVVTTILGVISALAGKVFGQLGSWPFYAISIFPIIFGLYLLKVIPLRLPTFSGMSLKVNGHFGAFVVGGLLGVVITPCATPILAGLLSYVAATGDPLWGGMLLFIYGIGLGIPIILVGTTFASLLSRLSSDKARRWSDNVTGVLLLGVGLYLIWIA
ncbi:MAG: cytochrome c biogenesis protein CcdA [Thermodesulfobacteriota bacterium]